MEKAQIIIGVPGRWNIRTEMIHAIAAKSEGYLMAGYILQHVEKDISFQVEVYDHDPDLTAAFNYAGQDSFDDSLLSEIEQHTFTIYVIADVKGFEDIEDIIEAGAALLKAGGLAVKIETTGLAHSKDKWLDLIQDQDYFPVYSHFVNLIGDEKSYFSCGMKAVELPDVAIPSSTPIEEAAALLNNFNLYNLVESPSFKNGEIFSMDENSPRFNVQLIPDDRYEEEDVFYNPFGILDLTPVQKNGIRSSFLECLLSFSIYKISHQSYNDLSF